MGAALQPLAGTGSALVPFPRAFPALPCTLDNQCCRITLAPVLSPPLLRAGRNTNSKLSSSGAASLQCSGLGVPALSLSVGLCLDLCLRLPGWTWPRLHTHPKDLPTSAAVAQKEKCVEVSAAVEKTEKLRPGRDSPPPQEEGAACRAAFLQST